MKKLNFFIFIILLFGNCTSLMNNIKDRGNDAVDIFEFNVAYGGIPQIIPFIQAQATIGSRKFGFSFPGDEPKKKGFGLRGGELGYFDYRDESFLINLVEVIESKSDDPEKIKRIKLRRKSYCGPSCSNHKNSNAIYTRLGIDFGLIFEIHIGFNPGELADFLLGFVGIDIYKDDYYKANSQDKTEEQ